MALGDAYIDVHANNEPFRRDLEEDIPSIGRDADDLMEKIGEGWGAHLSDGAKSELRKRMPDVVREFERGAKSVKIRIGGENFLLDRRGEIRDVAGRFVAMFTEEAARAFERAGRPGGPLSKIGEGFSDAIGAAFNISGRSPLIAVLPLVFGAIAEAIAVVVQAVNALIAVLVQVPSLLIAIGLQAGVLMIAFDGVGEAISGAFKAKNWNEFYAAIQGLTPAAQNFVVTLLPLRDLFRELKTSVQENFFTGLGNVMVNVAQQLGPILRQGLPQLATALGEMFKQIGFFFASPVFVGFIQDVIPATIRWLGKFGPGFTSFLTGLIRMADAALPALERLGDIVGSAFAIFTSWLNEQVNTGNLTAWLDDMSETLSLLVDLFFNAAAFVASFLDALNKGGGNDAIRQFSELFNRLAIFFGSEAGQAAMAGFIHLVELLTFSFSGLVFTLLGLLIAFESILAFFGFIGAEFMKFIDWLDNTAGPAIGKFFTETIPGFFSGLWDSVVEIWDKIVYYIQTAWGLAVDFVKDTWNDFMDWIGKRVDDFVGFFTNLPDRLAQIGRDIMHGLWQGIQDGWNNTVKPILDAITRQIPDWKGPRAKDLKLLQPAGKAVMEGFAKGLEVGAVDVKDMLGEFTRDISMGGVNATNNFSTNLNFMGQAPTESQARTAGRAASDELNKQVANTNIRLAYRVA